MVENLLLPVYIDTNLLLDLLASVEGGFSLVEKVTTRATTASEQNKAITAEAGTEFGIPNFLNLLKIKLSGSASASSLSTADTAEEIQSERYHTYGSLLHRLRNYLDNQGMIKRFDADDSWATIQAADFVEIHGLVRPNPLIDSLEQVKRIAKLAAIFTDAEVGGHKAGGRSARKSSASKTIQSADSDAYNIGIITNFIDRILEDAYSTNIRRFVIDIIGLEKGTAVILIFTNYLRDATLTEISHKEYRILGKVVRKLTSSSERPVSLTPGTALDGVGNEIVIQIKNALSASKDFNFPELETTVSGPALEIVPIAIYV